MRHCKSLLKAVDILKHLSEDQIKDDIDYLKSFGMTVQLIIRYIEKMGNRWDREKAKQAYFLIKNNPARVVIVMYNVEYNSLAYNITQEDAQEKIDKLKRDKTTNLNGFIARHGEKEGKKAFKKFQKTSKSSSDNIKNDLKSKFGDKWKKQWEIYNKNHSVRCKEFYLTKGLAKTEAEALEMVRQHQFKTAGVYDQYYIERGYSVEEIEETMEVIKAKKRLHSRNRKYLIEKHGSIAAASIYKEISDRYRKNMENRGNWLKQDEIDSYRKYKLRVEFLTEHNIIFHNILHLEKRSPEWHIDHIFSIKQGYIQEVEPEIIACPINLQIVHASYNCSKRDRCDMSLDCLRFKYIEWKEKNK